MFARALTLVATGVLVALQAGGSFPDDPIAELLNREPISRDVEDEILDELRELVEDPDRAAALRADSLLAQIPTLADWRPLIRAELLAMAGDTAGSRQALEEVDPATELAERWRPAIQFDALLQAGDSARALDHLLERGPSTHREAGDLALALGDTALATGLFRELVHADPDGPQARVVIHRLIRLDADATEDERRIRGRALLAAGDWRRAEDLLGPLVQDQELQLGLARGAVELRQLDRARELLDPLIEPGVDAPDGIRARALYWSARTALSERDETRADALAARLAAEHPDHRLAEDALLLLLDDAGGPGTGRGAELFGTLMGTGIRSGGAELVTVRHGADQYLSGEYREASTTFARYLESSGSRSGRQQAAYWHALVQLQLGEDAAARELLRRTHDEDPLSFYGLLAGERLDLPVLPADLESGPPPVPGLDRELTNALTRLRVHQVVPTPGSFNHEFERLQRHFERRGDGLYDFAERLVAGDLPIQGVVLGRQLHAREGEWNVRLLRIVHPFPHREEITREAAARGLDPFFVAGLIRQESLFNRTIESAAGAVGLMQLMPATAREVASSLGVRYSREQLEDPAFNARLGTQYLATMLRRFDGRAEDALSAYNAGPGRMNQWRRQPEYGDRDAFVEHIPFQETRNYVKVVQQNTRIYTALYGCPDFSPCLGESYLAARARSPVAGGLPGSSLAR